MSEHPGPSMALAQSGRAPESTAVSEPTGWATIDETDEYASSVKGVAVEAVRIGPGSGPNSVFSVAGPRATLSSCRIGFPIATHAHIDDAYTVAAFIHSASPGSRWCGISLRQGMVIAYGPQVEHVAVNRPGLEFTFAAVAGDDLGAAADGLGLELEPLRSGEVRAISPSDHTAGLGVAMDGYNTAAGSGARTERHGHDVLRAIARVLEQDDGHERVFDPGRAIDSRSVVHSCIDYAEATDRIPALVELCGAAHVSERRLREAFIEEFDVPPSRFFRAWALDEAHRRLRDAVPAQVSVTDVAVELGFGHLGRFASYYRGLYGELPSATLRSGVNRAS